ncbi:MFS transporter [Agromyces intestinalis]|uniref:MFS transporter n=1 Tax=Agromyces intestinalis TaxID=2592652 RepID=A0A5C1YBC8_9MICO|nr:MFS transporter [Agromyces intestinalis]QEO13384.1 MFS transporter [Agromyces intestinalis]
MSAARRALWAGRSLALIGILLLAFNLRSAVASLSPVLAQVEADVPLSAVVVGLLGMLPPVCYAVFGLVTPAIARRWGLERPLIAALVLLVIGLAGRGLVGDATGLVVASVITFAAMGVGNVLLPLAVKRYFPDRIGLMTTLYVTAMSISTLLPPLIAVPVAEAAGWRVELGLWAVFAVAALVPWLALAIRSRAARAPGVVEPDATQLRHALRSPLAWALTVVFAGSSVNAYTAFAWLPRILQDIAGSSAAAAGALLSLYAAMGLVAGLVVPIVAARWNRVPLLIGVSVASFALGYLGLLVAPATATWLWVVLIGTGPLIFPLSLVLINLRTRTQAGAVALSGFVQSAGYLIAAAGPLVLGVLHDATGSWSLPLVLLLATAVPVGVAGLVVARPRMFEDERAR